MKYLKLHGGISCQRAHKECEERTPPRSCIVTPSGLLDTFFLLACSFWKMIKHKRSILLASVELQVCQAVQRVMCSVVKAFSFIFKHSLASVEESSAERMSVGSSQHPDG